MSEILRNRYEIVYLFEVRDGNPNGDPDNDNRPRTDMSTGHGLVTDGCVKRKVRDYLDMIGEEIFFRTGVVLNRQIVASFESLDKKVKEENRAQAAKAALVKKYFDLRAFGGVLSTGKDTTQKAGQVQGPVQVNFARSVSPIEVAEHAITRKSVTSEKEAEAQIADHGSIQGTIGRKYTVPYALYRCLWTVTPARARDTGFSMADLSKILNSLVNMWDVDRSSTRGVISPRLIQVFEHECPKGSEFALGRASLASIDDRVKVTKKGDIEPRSFSDYHVKVDIEGMPEGLRTYNILSGEGAHLTAQPTP